MAFPKACDRPKEKALWVSALRALRKIAWSKLLSGAGGRPGHPHDADFGVRVDQGSVGRLLVHGHLLVK